MTKIKIERAKATAQNRELLTTGMAGAKIAFSFDEEWNGLKKTAVFSCGDTLLDVPESDWENGVCTVPHECMTREGLLTVGVYGVNSDGSIAIPTVYVTLGRIWRGADPSGNEGGAVTLPIWLRLSEMIGDLSELETDDKSDLVAAVNEVSETLDEHKVDENAHSDIRALMRRTWYVTVTRASDDTVTADKTPQEIYEAYQAGFTVYAMTSTFPGFNNVPFLIPCLAAIEFSGLYQIGFATSGTTSASKSPTSMVIFYDASTWHMWDHKLVSTDDVVDDLTTGDSTKVLSAAQGKALKGLIDECSSTFVVEISEKPNEDKVFIADKSFNEIAVAYENGAEVKAVYLGRYEMPLVYMGDDKFVFNAIYDGALLTAVINSDNNVVDMVAQDVFPEETDPTVPAWAKAATKPTYTAAEVGADASGTAASAVSAHNTSSSAHNDIRQLITSLSSSKVSVSDIVNNLTSDVANKPLSAAQGKVLKGLIDGIDIPTVPTVLPNPNALTIKIGSSTVVYDGSAAKTVEITDGSEVEY